MMCQTRFLIWKLITHIPIVDDTGYHGYILSTPRCARMCVNSPFGCASVLSTKAYTGAVVPTKSDIDVILCLQLLSKTLTCTLHLSIRKSIYHLCIISIQ